MGPWLVESSGSLRTTQNTTVADQPDRVIRSGAVRYELAAGPSTVRPSK
jgi:hypothetical protein